MEKKNGIVCEICNKSFSSGKAIGGHMRSHLAIYPIPPKLETENQALDNAAELAHYPIQSASALTSHPKKKPTQNSRSLKRDSLPSLVNSDKENESGSYLKNPTRKRSKCHRKFTTAAAAEDEQKKTISIPETLRAVEAARSLLMLSKDKWPESEEIKSQKMKETNIIEAKDGENGRDDLLVQTRSRSRFKCEWCGKMFRTYQALGGHKASHKKIKNLCQEGGDIEDEKGGNNSDVVDEKVFECTYCSKVFKSAQALGGHKKVHFSHTMVTNAHATANEFGGKLVVDLNFPAPKEDEKVSLIKFSSMCSEE
ncbi:zinc finger protein ZAT9-like [Gastrolobium bilobum]|uniref:zinc finger protein ZAT9-like n=1 Tax=Gastrolobium bilobum TaxID=150636 RepID=UPI002AB222F2|nr:zinc finger protein ZAT9-like [Gastrolobium bilobum]